MLHGAAIYFAVAWAVSEALTFIFEAWQLPMWTVTLLATLFVVGFPVAMFLVWVFDVGPGGVHRTPPSSTRGELSILAAIVLLIGGTAGLFYLIYPVQQYEMQKASHRATRALPSELIAVLPFEDLSPGEDATDSFVEGIHEDILTRLSRIKSLKVISRTSVLRYRETQKTIPEIGRELGVGTLLDGSVQRAGDQLHFSVQLIDANTDQHLWGESFDRRLTLENIFAIQSEISESVADTLRMTLTQQELTDISASPTENLEAYQLYLQGRYALHRRGDSVSEAIEILERVVEMDPNFARAWAILGTAYAVLPNWSNVARDVAYPLARKAAQKAIELDDTLGQPHALVAGINEELWNWEEAEEGFRTALALEPNNAQIHQWYGELLYSTGRLEDAYLEIQKAAELDPLSPLINLLLGYVYSFRNENELTIHHASVAHDRGLNSWQLHKILGFAYLREGRLSETRQAFLTANNIGGPGVWPSVVTETMIDSRTRETTIETLMKLRREGIVSGGGLCYYSAMLGDMDQAYTSVPELVQETPFTLGDWWLSEFKAFRRDPRFIEFARQTGLLEYWNSYVWPDLCQPVDDGIECE